MDRPSFISREDLKGYIDRGFENFKLVGRGLPPHIAIDSYIYYLVKEDSQDFIRKQMEKKLQEYQLKASRQTRR